ncbi:hypothetical protein [Ensifer aridi]|uniref:hypothetical protein n=1 Tax=Ensifer aridi TaxID=1708715 RepID=UPI000A0FAB87|nr:hypothetical protein [Ensifer aridi]
MRGQPESPRDEGEGLTALEDAILGLLEDAGIETSINDEIMKLVELGERRKYEADSLAESEFSLKGSDWLDVKFT